MPLYLQKHYTRTFEVRDVHVHFANFDDDWRRFRKERSCFHCGISYQNGDWIAQLVMAKGAPKYTCNWCGEQLREDLDDANPPNPAPGGPPARSPS